MKKLLLFPCFCIASALAYSSWDSHAASQTPHGAVESSVRALRKNDLKGFITATADASEIAEMKAQWEAQRKKAPEASEAAQFEQTMAMLTAPSAEQQIMQMIEPKLAEMKPQVAMMIGMFSGMAQASIEQEGNLNDAEKVEAKKTLDALAQLLQKNDITSVESARKAVALVCKGARKLNMKTMEDVRALSFDQLLAKGDIGLAALKDVLAIYGLRVDQMLDSFKASTLREEGDSATVRITFQVLGNQHSVDTEMVRVDGRWLRKEMAEKQGAFN